MNFLLHNVPNIGVHPSLWLAHRPGVTLDINVVGAQIRRDTLHIRVLPGKFPLILFQESDQAFLFIRSEIGIDV